VDDEPVIADWIKRRPLLIAAGYWLIVLVLIAPPREEAIFPSWLGWVVVSLMDLYPFLVLGVILTRERQSQLGESRTGAFVLGVAGLPVVVTFIGVYMAGLPVWMMFVAGVVSTAAIWMGSRAMRSVTVPAES
jgi:uncharacterized membrane protein SirB2